MNDTDRLNWLAKQPGAALINDDHSRWAFASDGFQNVPGEDPIDIVTTYLIEKHAWAETIREALDLAIKNAK